MDRNRGILVVAGSFALLAAGVALTMLVRRQQIQSAEEHIEQIEGMIEEYEKYTESEGTKKAKPRAKKPRGVAAKNGHMARSHVG